MVVSTFLVGVTACRVCVADIAGSEELIGSVCVYGVLRANAFTGPTGSAAGSSTGAVTGVENGGRPS